MKKNYLPKNKLIINDRWVLCEFFDKKQPGVIRVRTGLKDFTKHPDFSVCMRIIWNFKADNGGGLPKSDILEKMVNFEDQIITEFEKDLNAILV